MKTGMGIHQPKTQFAVDYKTSMIGPWYRLPMTYDGFFDAERHCKRWTYQTGGYPARVVSIDENGREAKRKPVTVTEAEKPALMAEINKCAESLKRRVYDPLVILPSGGMLKQSELDEINRLEAEARSEEEER